jgi:hypothetical protein
MIQVVGCVPRAHLHWQAAVVIVLVPSAVVVRFEKYLPAQSAAAGKPSLGDGERLEMTSACWHHQHLEMASACQLNSVSSACHLNSVSQSQALDWRQKGRAMASSVVDDRPWEHSPHDLPTLLRQAQGHGRYLRFLLLMEAAQCLRRTHLLC